MVMDAPELRSRAESSILAVRGAIGPNKLAEIASRKLRNSSYFVVHFIPLLRCEITLANFLAPGWPGGHIASSGDHLGYDPVLPQHTGEQHAYGM